MGWENIVTWLGAFGSLATIFGVVLQLRNGASFSRKNIIRSMLMFHVDVYSFYKKHVKDEIDTKFEGFPLKKFIILFLFIAGFIVAGTVIFKVLALTKNFNTVLMISVIVSSVLSPIVLSFRWRTLFNISLPVLVLGIMLFTPKLPAKNKLPLISYPILAFSTEILLLFLFTRLPLMAMGRELGILEREESIKESTFGLSYTFSISGALLVMWWIFVLNGDVMSYWKEITAGLIGFLVLAYLIVDVINTSIRLLWKAKVRDFADNLPYLIVKTKTGNIYYGQLYDPLDSKVLVLRKSKLMHGGQIVEDKNDLILWASQESAGDYWIISWKDIESIKIIEDGLYEPPKPPTDNSISQSTDNNPKEESGNPKRKNTETDSKPKT
ncbi:hypothetical protein [Thermococcus sp.]|uniref:hypothetical protein n=1 Tax=Thermococcus sp. TaxID=35749 RepID=UPI002628B966|nr:hypothetical protein [Thermococcus sp.]